MVHNEKEHIEDSWLVNTKREQNMMNSENENMKTKTEEPQKKKSKLINAESDSQLKKLSDVMDEKVLMKRKLEDERELIWQKEKEKGNKMREDKRKQENIKEKARLDKVKQLYKI